MTDIIRPLISRTNDLGDIGPRFRYLSVPFPSRCHIQTDNISLDAHIVNLKLYS